MTTATTAAPATTQAHPGRVTAALAARQIRRGAGIVTAICAGMSALVVAMYHSQALDPAALVALARNPAIRTLFGEPVALDDPGGFTVWRTGAVLTVLLAVWSSLAATRITRGEEDTGRWHLLLSGRTPRRRRPRPPCHSWGRPAGRRCRDPSSNDRPRFVPTTRVGHLRRLTF